MAAVPPNEGVARGNGAEGADPLGSLAPIIAKLQPIVSQRLIEQGATNLSRHMLALKVGEIASAELEAMHHNLNLLERRTLIGALISSLPTAAPDGGSNGQAAAPATPNVPMTAQAAQVAQQAAAANALTNPGQIKTMSTKGNDAASTASRQSVEEAKLKIQPLVVDRIDIGAAARLDRDELGRQIGELVGEILREERIRLNQREQKDLVELLLDDMLGLGPLEPLLAEETVTDIMVNGPYQVYVERKGKLELTDVKFRDNQHVLNICSRIVSQVGRRVDESQPLCDARLLDGSRVNIIIPPLAIDGPSISIRKFSKKGITLDIMAKQRNISENMAKVLKIASRSRLNILISGGTGSGKTTLLNAMSQLIDVGERIVTIEDAAELQLQQPHVVRLETRVANLEGDGEITMRDLVKNSLRMRPDRIILGEVRGPEALDMLQAMNTGHDGSLGTIHANRPREALTRLENMIGMASINLPAKAVRTQISSAIDMIVQVSRMRDGMRRITSIMEVVGMEGDVITTQDLYTFEFEGEDTQGNIKGVYKSSGLRPHFLPKAGYFGLDRALMEAM
ncbi:MAG TPA: CpaF family protein [Candidatus Acidoferrum sp.]|nr:CpaF family protein [Candidatus Acidoferrum sp.]